MPLVKQNQTNIKEYIYTYLMLWFFNVITHLAEIYIDL